MCRFIAYMGNPLTLHEILFAPKNSLIKQSFHAKEMDEPLNGDGFGMGWYAKEIDSEPGLFRSIQPAWNDLNLKYLSKKLRSDCFFAHVRAASKARVSIDNCHPFHYKDLLFMHNGYIDDFENIKRPLQQRLSDEIYNWIQGQTDSEHIFALLLERLKQQKIQFDMNNLPHAIAELLQEINDLQNNHNTHNTTVINAVLTNGKSMIAIRYSSNPAVPTASLHYNVGSKFLCVKKHYHIIPPKTDKNDIVLIVSEPLTSFKNEWISIPANHMLLVNENLSVEIKSIF